MYLDMGFETLDLNFCDSIMGTDRAGGRSRGGCNQGASLRRG